MGKYDQFFKFTNYQIEHFFVYFVFAAIVALYLVIKSNSKYKIELFFISFYLLTGNYNDILLIKIPGFSLFKIPPIRFLYLMLLFLIIRKNWYRKPTITSLSKKTLPWFEVALYCYIGFLTISVLLNTFPSGFKVILDAIAFVIIIKALKLMADQGSYDLIGKSLIIGAVITSVLSFIQITIDPFFLRMGDDRAAFGSLLRANGMFGAEYYNAYYLIIAIAWTLITIKNKSLQIFLVLMFSAGVITTFMRMGWLILTLVLVTYLIFINKIAIEKLLLSGLSILTVVLAISIFFYQDIMNSSLVKERLTQDVDGRKGYYTMVLDNIGKKPFFGYGDLKNEVYYENLLRITRDRDRAEAKTGGIHSGYFSSLFLYGIPALVAFIFFVLLSVIYYSKSFKHNLYFVIPFLVSVIFMIGNLTNTFLFITYLSVLFALHIGIGMGIQKIEEESLNTSAMRLEENTKED